MGQYIIHGPGGVVLQLDTLDSYFAIGDTSGRPIMYDFNYPWERTTSPFIIRVDDDYYTNATWIASGCGATHLRDYRGDISTRFDGFATQWIVPFDSTAGPEGMIFTQELRAMVIDSLPACKISYMAYNSDTIPHRVGFYQNLDVLVGTNDEAPMAMSGSYTELGNILDSIEVPYFWQAFEISPGAGPDQVVARGLLRGIADKPDVFAFGQQIYLYDDCWVPDADVIGRGYFDSGVTIRWNPIYVNPMKYREVCTIYGFGQAAETGSDVICMPLVPNTVGSACDHWAQNPFEAAILVHNTGVEDGLDSLIACITLDTGLELQADAFHTTDSCKLISLGLEPDSTGLAAWLVNADSTYFTGAADPEIVISLYTSTEDVEIPPETTRVHIPDLAGIPPIASILECPENAVSCPGTEDIEMKYYIYDEAGIDPSSVIFKVGPDIVYYNDSTLIWTGDTVTVTLSSFYLVHGNAIDHGIVVAADSDGCMADSLPMTRRFYADRLAPEIGLPYPPDGSLVTDSLMSINLPLKDSPAGVNPLSIMLNVTIEGITNSYTVPSYTELEYFPEDSELVFTPSSPWPDSSEIEFCLVSASDLCDEDYCPANSISDTFCFTFNTNYSAISEDGKPISFSLKLFPNPFNASLSINAPLAEKLEIYDIEGRLIADLSNQVDGSSNNSVFWDGTDNRGSKVSSGIYLVKISRENQNILRRAILIR